MLFNCITKLFRSFQEGKEIGLLIIYGIFKKVNGWFLNRAARDGNLDTLKALLQVGNAHHLPNLF
jgi:hypothetical protein